MQRATTSRQSPQRSASPRLTEGEASSSALERALHPASPLLTEVEAADYMRLPPRTLTKWRSIGRGPRFTKAGRLARYRLEDIEAWLAKRASEEGA